MIPTEADSVSQETYFSRLNRLRYRWHDSSLTLLLVTQIITLFFIVPATADGFPMPEGAAVLLLLVVISLTIIMARGRWTLVTGLSTLLLTGATSALQYQVPSVTIEVARSFVALVAFSVLGIVVSKAIFSPGPFTNHRVRGAIVLYLNIGLLFSFLFRIIALLLPNAFSHLPNPLQEAKFAACLDYLSFTTITSVGFGDILPIRPLARSLCALEAIAGQLLPTVLIARVVSLAATGKDKG